jgi:FKBP-type peptidyl-prolyl cis-trans isomerase FklB
MLRFWLVLLCLCSSLAYAAQQDDDLAYSLGAKLGERLRGVRPR